jgi:N-acetylmuramoyl-L-alanine amidase
VFTRAFCLIIGLWFYAFPVFAAVSAVRLWPSPGYTRLTIESKRALSYDTMMVDSPKRFVLDIDGPISPAMMRLPFLLSDNDPYIKSIRVGQFTPQTSRIVLELKGNPSPRVFRLEPVEGYGHRLVIDLYGAKEDKDPIFTLVQQLEQDPPKRDEPFVRKKQVRWLIAIDPGHGGEDPGAIGAAGTYEKDVVLAIGKRLKALMDQDPDLDAVMTRSGDYFIPLYGRVAKARSVKADLFVSIHADASSNRAAQGASVYALSERGATSAAARILAQKENSSDRVGGVSLNGSDQMLARTLLDLSQTATINESLALGFNLIRRIGGNQKMHKERVEQAGFVVLKSPDIPSVLVETGFISNPWEEVRLKSANFQKEMAEAVYEGIKNYLVSRSYIARREP